VGRLAKVVLLSFVRLSGFSNDATPNDIIKGEIGVAEIKTQVHFI
jgi:hypothetical protein